jgi:hypothetical protein
MFALLLHKMMSVSVTPISFLCVLSTKLRLGGTWWDFGSLQKISTEEQGK